MEASVAGLPVLPGHRPRPPASCSDGDLGRRSPTSSRAPSSPFVQPLRWRPRSPVSHVILGAFQDLQPTAPKCARMRLFAPISRPDLASVVPVNHVNKCVNKSLIWRASKCARPGGDLGVGLPRHPGRIPGPPAGPAERTDLPGLPERLPGPRSTRPGGDLGAGLPRHPGRLPGPPAGLTERADLPGLPDAGLGRWSPGRLLPADPRGVFFKRGEGVSKPRRQPSASLSDFLDLRDFGKS